MERRLDPSPDHPKEPGKGGSRTQKKRDAQAIEALASEFLDLPAQDVGLLPIPPDLQDLVLESLRVKGHGARKRQLKYLAKHVRSLSPEELDAVRAHMAMRHGSRQAEIQKEKIVADIRDRLMYPESVDEALAELETRFPLADLGGVRELVQKNLNVPRRSHGREIYRLITSFWEAEQRRTRSAKDS